MMCEKCNTDKYILDDVSNGCCVCTECGLVATSHLCSEEAFFDKSTERMSHSVSNGLDSHFQLDTLKMNNVNNITFFSTQDQHKLKMMNFNQKFERVFQATQLHESVGSDAKYLYIDFEKKHSFKGRNIEFVICAFIFIAAKMKNHAINVSLFGREYETDIMKCVKFIEEKRKDVIVIKKPIECQKFHDKDIESFIRKYCKLVDINKKMTQDIIKTIHKAEFIMRKKEIIAIALIVSYKKKCKYVMKKLAKESCVSELAIKSSLRELVA